MEEVNSLLEKAKLTLDRLDSSLKIDKTHIAHMRNNEDYLRNYLFTEIEQSAHLLKMDGLFDNYSK